MILIPLSPKTNLPIPQTTGRFMENLKIATEMEVKAGVVVGEKKGLEKPAHVSLGMDTILFRLSEGWKKGSRGYRDGGGIG